MSGSMWQGMKTKTLCLRRHPLTLPAESGYAALVPARLASKVAIIQASLASPAAAAYANR